MSLSFKSGLISKKNGWQTPSNKREDAQDSDLAPFLGDLSQSEKNSKIKSSLRIV